MYKSNEKRSYFHTDKREFNTVYIIVLELEQCCDDFSSSLTTSTLTTVKLCYYTKRIRNTITSWYSLNTPITPNHNSNLIENNRPPPLFFSKKHVVYNHTAHIHHVSEHL